MWCSGYIFRCIGAQGRGAAFMVLFNDNFGMLHLMQMNLTFYLLIPYSPIFSPLSRRCSLKCPGFNSKQVCIINHYKQRFVQGTPNLLSLQNHCFYNSFFHYLSGPVYIKYTLSISTLSTHKEYIAK